MWNTDSSSSSSAGLRRLCHEEARIIATIPVTVIAARIFASSAVVCSNLTCTTLGRSSVNT